LLTQNQILNEIKRRSSNAGLRIDIHNRLIENRVSLPEEVTDFLKRIGIEKGLNETNLLSPIFSSPRPLNSPVSDDRIPRLVEHIFECLGSLQHLVRSNQFSFGTEDDETQSVCDQNIKSLGKLIHEMVSIYALCGDTLKVLLNSNPEAANVEDSYGRLPLHVAVDRDQPWLSLISDLILAAPDALRSR